MVQLASVSRLMNSRKSGSGSAPVVGTQYYVSSAGNDSNNGTTTGTPWLTLSKVNGFTFSAGDTISFNGGDTFAGTLTPPNSGTSGHPITFNSYGTGQATISAASGTDGITLTDKSYITINNFTLTSAGGSAGVGVNMVAAGGGDYFGLTVTNCNLTNFPSHGIFMSSGAGGTLNDITITSCIVDACCYGPILRTAGIASHGASLSARNVTITSCVCKNNTGSLSAVGNWSGSGIYLGQCNVGLIDNCQADNNGVNGDGPTGIWTASSIAVIMQNCESKNTKTAGGDGGGFDMDGGCQNCITQYCYSHDNIGFGYLNFSFDTAARKNDGNIIRYCTSVNDLAGGAKITSSALDNTNAQIYGCNFILTSSNEGIRLDKSTGSMNGGVIANNNIVRTAGSPVFITNAVSPGSSANFHVTGNNYFTAGSFSVIWAGTTYATLLLWQTATGQEKISGVSVATQVDPVFIGTGPAQFSNVTPQLVMDPYRLSNSSTLIGGAVNLWTNYAINPGRDYFGSVVDSSTTNWTAGICSNKSAVSQVLYTTSGTKTIPADYVQTYLVECIGAGGSVNASSAGAGGGAYAAAPIALSASQSVNVVIGAAVSTAKGGDTVFNATSLANAQSLGPTVAVGAEGGNTNVAATGGIGGSTANSVGTIKNAGGNGSQTASSRSGGGGAGSRFGPGRDGGAGSGSAGGGGGGAGGGGAGAVGTTNGGRGGSGPYNIGGAGGAPAGSAGTKGAGGGGGATTAGAGGAGAEWIISGSPSGPGGGGGGANGVQAATNVGGAFGGGGGGRNNALGGAGGARLLYQTSANI
jgi:hypothetical protein